MDLQNEAIELQKIFHQDYKTYWEETEAIKAHLEARFKALRLHFVVGQSELLNAFLEWRLTNPHSDFQTREYDIKEFLKEFNCS